MDFLKELALPQSLEHYHLVILLATISALVFVPYISYLLGASTLSLWFNRRARRTNDDAALRFSRAVVDVALYNKSVVTFLAIIPGLSLVFSYAQILQSSPAIATGLAALGFLSLLAGLVLLYSYKYTFRVQRMLDAYANLLKNQKNAETDEVASYSAANTQAHERTGRWGLSFLYLGAVLYTAAYTAAASTTNWTQLDSLFAVAFSLDFWLRLFTLAGCVAGATGLGVQFFLLVWEQDRSPDSSPDYVVQAGFAGDTELIALTKHVGLQWSIVGLLTLPIFIIGNIIVLAPSSISTNVYGLATIVLTALFTAGHFVYGYRTTGNTSAISYGLFAFMTAVSVSAVNDYVAIGNTSKLHAASLAYVHEKSLEELRTKLGVGAPPLTGEDIFNAKCSACHLFDQKKVGPPYFETIPKYAAKKADLLAFILSPQKINPAYPPMPNQGLKTAEADSIAMYIMHKVAAAGKMKLEAAPPAK